MKTNQVFFLDVDSCANAIFPCDLSHSFYAKRRAMMYINFYFLYSSEKCDSPLGISLPDNRWSASSTSNRVRFGAHRGRMNNSPDTVGWCSSTAKEEKAFIEVTGLCIFMHFHKN